MFLDTRLVQVRIDYLSLESNFAFLVICSFNSKDLHFCSFRVQDPKELRIDLEPTRLGQKKE